MSWENKYPGQSPLIQWINSIPIEYSQEPQEEIIYEFTMSLMDSYRYGSWEAGRAWAINKAIRRLIVKMIEKYDLKITRHILKDLKIKNVIYANIYVKELSQIGDNFKFEIGINHKFVEIG